MGITLVKRGQRIEVFTVYQLSLVLDWLESIGQTVTRAA